MNTSAEPALRYEFALIEQLRDDALLRGMVGLGLFVLAVIAIGWYWRERQSLRRGLPWLLAWFRLVALAAIAVMLLGPQRRVAEVQTRPSKVVVLVDTTLSMSLNHQAATATNGKQSRSAAALAALAETTLVQQLAERHEVEVRATSSAARWQPPTNSDLSAGHSDADPSDADLSDDGPSGIVENTTAKVVEADWREAFRPIAADTRLGDAVMRVLEEHAGRPLAGLLLLSDGQHNAGRDALPAATAVQEQGATLHTIGFGPNTPGVNLAVRDVIAPSRAYPKDEIEITTLIEGTDTTSNVAVSLFRRREGDPPTEEELLETKTVRFEAIEKQAAGASDIRQQSIAFTTQPEAVGRYVYIVRLVSRTDEIDLEDNVRSANVEVIDRVLRVLLLAGGPTRDYRFLRDQLRRDDAFKVDVLLQSLGRGAIQDVDQTLSEFPATVDEIGAYDVIVALDPDWRQLGESAQEQIEAAVSERGAGLLFVPGPVHTPRWLGARGASRLKTLLPVAMPDRWLALSGAGEASRVRSSIDLTTAGDEAEFMWIAGGRERSLQAWQSFPGFYRCFPVQTIKPGAVVYARMDAATQGDAALAGATGVVLAEQFFGAGRVMVLTSSELWRLRSVEPTYFTAFTTKLLQHLAQGRLLANSPGGSLLFERERLRVGDTVALRATRIEALESLTAQVIEPDGSVRSVELRPSESQPDAWIARWTATTAGVVRAVVKPPRGDELSARAEVSVPALERGGRTRDEVLLNQLATLGGGHYYPTVESALDGTDDLPPLTEATPSRAETTVVFGQPDQAFAEQVSKWVLGLAAGCLLAEWLVRRLNRLA